MNRHQKTPHDFSITFSGDTGEPLQLSLSGHMSFQNLTSIQTEIRSIFEKLQPSSLTIDMAGVDYLDSAGALALLEMDQYSERAAIPCSYENLSVEIQGILGLIDRSAVMVPPPSSG